MTTDPLAHPATPASTEAAACRRWPGAWLAGGAFGLLGLVASPAPAQARPSYDGSAPTCFLTAGGALEICRDGSEAEGVLAAPPPCSFVRGVQLFRPKRSTGPGPIQAIFQGESPAQEGRRRGEDCPERRATDPNDGGTLKTGRSPEQLATILPLSEARFGFATQKPERRDRRRKRRDEAPPENVTEGIGPRDPVAVSGRDWAGEEYSYVFLLALQPVENGERRVEEEPRRRGRSRRRREEGAPASAETFRRVQIEARTLDFVNFEIRTRGEDGQVVWMPVQGEERRRRAPLQPAPVLDETGKPLTSACPAPALQTHGLSGSISIVERTYHFFYTDVLPEDCGLPAEKRRTGLFLRTATDLAVDKVWSSPRRLGSALPANSLVRVARAKGATRWAVSYTCDRPANAPGGPVEDICLQYTADLNPDSIASLTLYAEPVEAGRSPAYLGLRSGGDGGGRFDRSAHFWMTDSYGNLDVPATYGGKSGFLTWVDRLSPGAGGSTGSRVYGRPAFWATWTARRTGTP
jgi:hypothetical protein